MQGLTDPPRDTLTEAQVLESLSWEHSTRMRWGCTTLDTASLEPTGIELKFIDASVSWQWRAQPLDGVAPVPAQVRRRGSLRYRHEAGFNPLAVLYRIWIEMDTADGTPVRWHLGVFTGVLPPFEYDGRSDRDGPLVRRPLELADRSHLWVSVELDDPIIVEEGTDIVQWVRDDLSTRFNEFDVSGIIKPSPPPTASDDYIFDAGTPMLQVYSTLMGAIGSEPVHADAEGRPRSRPVEDPEERVAEHSYAYATTVAPQATIEAVNPDLPNVVRFVAKRPPSLAEEGNGIRTIVNESTGPGSIQQRGRQVLMRVEVDAETQEELDAQARHWAPFYFAGGGLRYLGDVGLNPRHDDSDVVFLERPALGIAGNWLVTSWSIQLGESVSSMRVMRLELEQLTGAAFHIPPPPDEGAFATVPFGTTRFGGG